MQSEGSGDMVASLLPVSLSEGPAVTERWGCVRGEVFPGYWTIVAEEGALDNGC